MATCGKAAGMDDSREFQDVESICNRELSHVPSQRAVVPSPRSMLSRDQSLRSDTWNLSKTQGNVFGNPQTPYHGILHSLNQNDTGGHPVQKSTGKLVAESEEQNRDTIPVKPRFARKLSTMNSFFPPEGPQNYTAAQQRVQISELHFDKFLFNVYMLEDKIQNPSKCLFRFSYGSCAVDQRSGDGRFCG